MKDYFNLLLDYCFLGQLFAHNSHFDCINSNFINDLGIKSLTIAIKESFSIRLFLMPLTFQGV